MPKLTNSGKLHDDVEVILRDVSEVFVEWCLRPQLSDGIARFQFHVREGIFKFVVSQVHADRLGRVVKEQVAATTDALTFHSVRVSASTSLNASRFAFQISLLRALTLRVLAIQTVKGPPISPKIEQLSSRLTIVDETTQ